MPTIFISYRRDDAVGSAGRLCDWLKRQFKAERVFLDTESIAPGEEFPRVLRERLAATDVLVAVVGPKWVSITDDAGKRRIEDPKDFVALEVATALGHDIRLVPALVGGARMPRAEELPPALVPLADRHAVSIDDTRFEQDFENLVDAILGRPRGFRRRQLDRLRRLALVAKATPLIAPVVAVVIVFAAWTSLFDLLGLDTKIASYSMWVGEQFAGETRRPQVLLVAIDDDTERRLGRPYEGGAEWRRYHARVIDRLAGAGAATVVFDLFFESGSEADGELTEAIRRARQNNNARVVLGARSASGGRPALVPAFLDAGAEWGALCISRRLGYAFTVPLAVIRETMDRRTIHAEHPALALVAAFDGRVERIDKERRELIVRGVEDTHFIGYSALDPVRDAPRECATLMQGETVAARILRVSPAERWRDATQRVSYGQLLEATGAEHLDRFRGKTVIVGVTTKQGRDLHTVVRGLAREQVYGVELQADAIIELADGVAVRPLGMTAQWLFAFALAATGAVASFFAAGRSVHWRMIVFTSAVLAYFALGIALYLLSSVLVNVLYDLAAFVIGYKWLSYLQTRAMASPREDDSLWALPP